MHETSKGLPNTCSRCGQPQRDTWFAANDDEARAGGGICRACWADMAPPPVDPVTAPPVAAVVVSTETPIEAAAPAVSKKRTKRGAA